MSDSTVAVARPLIKQCPTCGDQFTTSRKGQRYCQRACASYLKPKYRPNGWDNSPRKCSECGGEFVPVHPNHIRCSPACCAAMVDRTRVAHHPKIPCRACGKMFPRSCRQHCFCSKTCQRLEWLARPSPTEMVTPEQLRRCEGVRAKRDPTLTTNYVWLLRHECANPGCQDGHRVEGHHVTPWAKGGADAYWNIVALCFDCHRRGRCHSGFDARRMELNVWKAMHERRVLGFYMDEKEPGFHERLAKAWNRQVELDKAEKKSP